MRNKTMNKKTLLSKYLLGGAVVGALALCPMPSHADDMMANNKVAMSAEPMLVTGTVGNYYLDRSGFVTAMSVNTATGTEYVRFSPSKAQTLYQTFPVGSTINVWVTPGTLGSEKYWDARGLGVEKPAVWMPINMTRDYEWLNSEAYVSTGPATGWDGSVSGNLKGVILDSRGDVVGLVVNTDNGKALVRVPPELRQNARGYIGTNRVAPLIQGARIRVSGTPEAPRLGTLSKYPWRVAANTIAVNGKSAGAIGIQMLPPEERNALINFSIGGDSTENDMLDAQAARMGYMIYKPGENDSVNNNMSMTQQATGRVMIVTADGQLLPVVKMNRKIYVSTSNGNVELMKVNGKYIVPTSMEGARMQMVMSDGRRMEMDTVDGQLMVIMADGTMAPVTLHTP
jgi:hypothetical protein